MRYWHIAYKMNDSVKTWHCSGLAKSENLGDLLISCTDKNYWVSRITEITKEDFKALRKPMKSAEKRDPRRKKNKNK